MNLVNKATIANLRVSKSSVWVNFQKNKMQSAVLKLTLILVYVVPSEQKQIKSGRAETNHAEA